MDGTILATCSTKGTLIRLFDTERNEIIKEVRRGTVSAEITNVTINAVNTMMACASNQGTVHLFKIGAENTKSSLNSLGSLSSYFSSEWSSA